MTATHSNATDCDSAHAEIATFAGRTSSTPQISVPTMAAASAAHARAPTNSGGMSAWRPSYMQSATSRVTSTAMGDAVISAKIDA